MRCASSISRAAASARGGGFGQPGLVPGQIALDQPEHPEHDHRAGDYGDDLKRLVLLDPQQDRGRLDQDHGQHRRDEVEEQPPPVRVILHQDLEHDHAVEGDAEGLGGAAVKQHQVHRRERIGRAEEPGTHTAGSADAGRVVCRRCEPPLLDRDEAHDGQEPARGQREAGGGGGRQSHDEREGEPGGATAKRRRDQLGQPDNPIGHPRRLLLV